MTDTAAQRESSSSSARLTVFISALSEAIRQRDNFAGAVTPEEVQLLFSTASHALEGSLIEMACLRLLCSLLKADPRIFAQLLKGAELASTCCCLSHLTCLASLFVAASDLSVRV